MGGDVRGDGGGGVTWVWGWNGNVEVLKPGNGTASGC